MRIALFTLESTLSAAAVARFLRNRTAEVVLIGRSAPFRHGAVREAWRHLRRSGPRLMPYLLVNYGLPQWLASARRLAGGWGEITAIAAARGIPIVEVTDVNGPAMQAELHMVQPDLIVSFHFDQIFAPTTLALARGGGINLHPSLLPRHRGPVPTIWALAEDPPVFGVTVHRLTPRIDAGAILAQAAVPLPADVTASAATRMLHMAGVPLLESTIAAIAAGTATERTMAPLPYCPFPPPTLLRELARKRRRVVDLNDLRETMRVRIG